MPEQRLTREQVGQAEGLVAKIRGVSSCHITTNEAGEITEVHVVSTVRKPPKLVARDVESCLKAEMGIDVDYRKIGVVHLEEVPPPDTPAVPAVVPSDIQEFPVEEFPSRFAFHSINLFVTKDGARAEVELTRDEIESFGTATSENPSSPPWRTIAEATLRAVAEFLDDDTRLCLGELLKVALGEKTAFVVSVDVLDGRNTKSLAGCSIVVGNENQTVVHATLDAVNRVIGKLDFKSFVDYKIR